MGAQFFDLNVYVEVARLDTESIMSGCSGIISRLCSSHAHTRLMPTAIVLNRGARLTCATSATRGDGGEKVEEGHEHPASGGVKPSEA